MTTIEQKPQSQSSFSSRQSGDDNVARQSEQQSADNKCREKSQSAQEDKSFTISADDFLMM